MNIKLTKNERGFIVPSDKKQKIFFEHCSGGMEGVTQERLETFVEPMLFFHGITSVECDWIE